MGWTLSFARAAERDFELIFDHLFESYLTFGETPAEAIEHAYVRIQTIRQEAGRILTAPHRGVLAEEILPGSRCLALGKATYWFDVDETARNVTVRAVFFGAEDTRRKMILRLLSEQS